MAKYLIGIGLFAAYATVFSSLVAAASDGVQPVQPMSTQQGREAVPAMFDNSPSEELIVLQPPPPLDIDTQGDTIYTSSGREIGQVIVVRQAPLKLTYEGFFEHPRLARRYTTSILMTDVVRVERSSEQDHQQLREAWDRQTELANEYSENIKRSGFVMFRGKWVTPAYVESIRQRKREIQARWFEAQAEWLQAEAQRTQAAAAEQRRWVARSLQIGQNAAVLDLLGRPSSQQHIFLATGIVQTDAVWNQLGFRVIVHNGYIAFIERFVPRTASTDAVADMRPDLSKTEAPVSAQTGAQKSQ